MKTLVAAALLLLAGCAECTFVNVGNNTAVPTSHVRKYAKDHGVSFQEAACQIGSQAVEAKQIE